MVTVRSSLPLARNRKHSHPVFSHQSYSPAYSVSTVSIIPQSVLASDPDGTTKYEVSGVSRPAAIVHHPQIAVMIPKLSGVGSIRHFTLAEEVKGVDSHATELVQDRHRRDEKARNQESEGD